jgi:2-phospho-L-lactate guanylyltransferase
VVLPVKHGEQAKTRLVTPPHVDRLALARAVALDSVAAAYACPAVLQVVVVTSDPVVRAAVAGHCELVADPRGGLLPAIEAGLRTVPTVGQPVAVLLADVPALTPEAFALALAACGQHESAFVPDLEGTGTVLLTSRGERRLRPAFGVGSADLHEAGGAVRLELDLPVLRRDVDTWQALQQALALGGGPATRAATTSA